jgi:hypothetical protein
MHGGISGAGEGVLVELSAKVGSNDGVALLVGEEGIHGDGKGLGQALRSAQRSAVGAVVGALQGKPGPTGKRITAAEFDRAARGDIAPRPGLSSRDQIDRLKSKRIVSTPGDPPTEGVVLGKAIEEDETAR